MAIYVLKQCDYCHEPIVGEQRWVREKIFNPRSDGRDASYRHYHAEPFASQDDSCWEKHQMQRELARTAA